MQQYLPFTVLKPSEVIVGICNLTTSVATVLTVYGIETIKKDFSIFTIFKWVATVLTVYGIETNEKFQYLVDLLGCNSTYRLRY